jgi:chemotaxis protein histidine kinase CheA
VTAELTVAAAAEAEEPAAPRLVRVRVRRQTIPLQEALRIDITRQDTTILPAMRIFPPRLEPLERQPDTLPITTAAPEALVEEAPTTLHAETLVEPAAIEPEESVLSLEPLEAEAPEPAAEAPELPVPGSLPEVSGAEAPELMEVEVAEEAEDLEQPERRRMPTLAVMVALAPRAEPAPTAPLNEAEEAQIGEAQTEEPAVTLPAAPVAELTAATLDAVPVPADVAATEEPTEASAVTSTEELPATPAEQPTEAPAAEMPAAEMPAAETPAAETPAAETPAQSVAPSEDAPAPSSRAWMWWAQASRRQAPETRPIVAAEKALLTATSVAPMMGQDAENTTPRRAVRRTVTPVPAPQPAEGGAAKTMKTVAKRADAEVDALAQRRRAARARQRQEAKHSTRAVVLSWAAFGHAAVASVAALIAVIAGLRFSAGADAQAIFGWALALALIAGLGAWFGYLCAQLGRPLLATLALLLSQLGAVAWTLALLGPRAALLALAPASVALALRGAGRLSAIGAGLAWFVLYLADLALTLAGAQHPHLALGLAGAALVDGALALVGLWLIVNILISLYTSRMNTVAHGRAVEHVALQTEAQLARLRTQVEDDAEELRRALLEALRGEQPARVYARGPLSAVAEAINEMADRLVDLRYDRTERKRLESATRRLTRVIERAWLGLSWSWPDATGTILDDLLALLRMPPPPDGPALPDETAPTGQVIAPHLFRGWRPTEPTPRVSQPIVEQEVLPGMPSLPSQPSAPSLPSLLDGDTSMRLTTPLELPPSPRWRGSSAHASDPDQSGATER